MKVDFVVFIEGAQDIECYVDGTYFNLEKKGLDLISTQLVTMHEALVQDGVFSMQFELHPTREVGCPEELFVLNRSVIQTRNGYCRLEQLDPNLTRLARRALGLIVQWKMGKYPKKNFEALHDEAQPLE